MAKGLNLSGLGALFGDEALIEDQVECAMIPVAKISTAAGQARKYFDDELIDEIANNEKIVKANLWIEDICEELFRSGKNVYYLDTYSVT